MTIRMMQERNKVLVRFARHWPYLVAVCILAIALAAAVIGALGESLLLVCISLGAVVLFLASTAAIGYRRLIRLSVRTQRTAQSTLEHMTQSRAQADHALEIGQFRPAHALGSLEWWSRAASLNSAQLVQRLTTLRSVGGRDLLAKMATSGVWNWNELARALEAHRIGGTSKENVLPVFHGSSSLRLLQLADLCYRQNCLPQDLENVATLYLIVYHVDGPEQFHARQRADFFLDALSKTGLSEKAKELFDIIDGDRVTRPDRILFESNISHPRSDSNVTEQEWLEIVNRVYTSEDLARLTISDGSAPLFLRLGAEYRKPVVDGPLVSIVMPVYKPDAVTEVAVRSALDQTYRNIEIIVVDDGSGEKYSSQISAWQEQDTRVRVIRSVSNAGAYTSRNLGYEKAKGKYLTVFDGDDWQHPQKIEMLVRQAEEISDGRLVSALWTRVDEALFFQYRGWRGSFITPAHVSALFPVSLIREKLGYWDTVRKAADTEFILRYQLLINSSDPIQVSDAPLTLSLVGSGNLSIEDFRLGYRAPDRVAYRAAYEHWHRKVDKKQSSGYMNFPLSERLFPAPAKFLPTRRDIPHLDILFVSDFSNDIENFDDFRVAIDTLLEDDLLIGVLHTPSVVGKSLAVSPADSLLELFSEGKIVQVQKTDSVNASVALVTDPTAFQFESHTRGSIRPQNLYVMTQVPPYEEDTRRYTYEVSTVSANLYSEFGTRPLWAPTTGGATEVLSKVVSESDLLPCDDPQDRPIFLNGSEVQLPQRVDWEIYNRHVKRILNHHRLHIAKGAEL